MKLRRTRYGFTLRLDPGEEIVESLRSFAEAQGVRAGVLSAIGAALDIELGFFVRDTREYVRKTFEGEYEIGALTGNLSELDARPFPHVHVVIAGPDFVAYTGHLFRAIVSVTCEVQVVTDPEAQRRVRRPELGFNPLDLQNDEPGSR
jgi:predicted DNA-binding protein with PD1-like motif